MPGSCHSSGELHGLHKPSSQAFMVSSSSSTDKGTPISGVSFICGPIQKRNPVGQTFSAASTGVYTYGESFVVSHSHTTEEKIGVLLLNLGGPEKLHDVQPFLFNLFADPVCLSLVLPFFISFLVSRLF